MLGHEIEVVRLLHREHTGRLTHAARRTATAAPATATRKATPRKRLAGLAHLHLRARV
ncbi:MAG: hypothetical protein H0V94_08655 [Actinobacteria bacterium]|nr:hypothetical protein [Actinomycetota bacterium]